MQIALTWVSNVNLLSMTTTSDLITDYTGRLTPATDTVLTLDAAFNCDDDPTSIASDRPVGIQQQVIVGEPVLDGLRIYFECGQIGTNG